MKILLAILITFFIGQITAPSIEAFLIDTDECITMEMEEDSEEDGSEKEKELDEQFKTFHFGEAVSPQSVELSTAGLFEKITPDYAKVYLRAPYSPPEYC